jgi:prepilin-type processing-associated H-X9-DG protein
VIAIIAILIGLLLPAVQKVREAAARMSCSNNMKQLALACHSYESAHSKLPPPRGTFAAVFTAYRGWMCDILPYIEQVALHQQVDTFPAFFTGHAQPVKMFTCPSDPRNLLARPAPGNGALTSYLGVTGAYTQTTGVPAPYRPGDGVSARDGIFDPGPNSNSPAAASRGMRLQAITDGTSNTLLLGERPPDRPLFWGWWGASDYDTLLATVNSVYLNPATETGSNPICVAPGRFSPGNPNNACHSNHFYSMHTGGANWAMGDGSVRFLSYSAQPLTLPAATAAGGEVFNFD